MQQDVIQSQKSMNSYHCNSMNGSGRQYVK
jgi:hypothetical protein